MTDDEGTVKEEGWDNGGCNKWRLMPSQSIKRGRQIARHTDTHTQNEQ